MVQPVIAGSFGMAAFNETPVDGRGGRLDFGVTGTVGTTAVAVIAGDADTTLDRIWLKPEPTIYIPHECSES